MQTFPLRQHWAGSKVEPVLPRIATQGHPKGIGGPGEDAHRPALQSLGRASSAQHLA